MTAENKPGLSVEPQPGDVSPPAAAGGSNTTKAVLITAAIAVAFWLLATRDDDYEVTIDSARVPAHTPAAASADLGRIQAAQQLIRTVVPQPRSAEFGRAWLGTGGAVCGLVHAEFSADGQLHQRAFVVQGSTFHLAGDPVYGQGFKAAYERHCFPDVSP